MQSNFQDKWSRKREAHVIMRLHIDFNAITSWFAALKIGSNENYRKAPSIQLEFQTIIPIQKEEDSN